MQFRQLTVVFIILTWSVTVNAIDNFKVIINIEGINNEGVSIPCNLDPLPQKGDYIIIKDKSNITWHCVVIHILHDYRLNVIILESKQVNPVECRYKIYN